MIVLTSLRRRSLLLAAAAATVAPAWAQTWNPQRPIRMIVPYPPGGGADVTARTIVEKLGQKLGQTVVIENRGGAGGAIGAEVVYKAAPDGYTILFGNADIITIGPHLFSKLPYKWDEFVPIGPTAAVPFILAGRADLPAKTFPELVELAKKTELSFASWGNGSPGHLGSEMFKNQGKIPKVLTVPYQGTAPAVQALLAQQVDAMYMPGPLWLSMQSKVITYGAAATKRYERFKQVPVLAEFGVPIDLEVWQALFAPPGTPRSIVDRISKALLEVTADPEVRKKIEELGLVPLSAPQEEFARSIAPDHKRWGDVMRLANVQPQ
jgi:tripartite-type tricarboxylate transporter receptor subunit TctC